MTFLKYSLILEASRRCTFIRHGILTAFACAVCMAPVAHAEDAPDPLVVTLRDIAKDIHSFMDSKGLQSVDVQVEGPTRTSAAREIQSILIQELRGVRVTVGPSRITLEVKFRGDKSEVKRGEGTFEDTFQVAALVFLFELKDRTGEILTSFEESFPAERRVRKILNETTIVHALGIPAELKPTDLEHQRGEHLLDRMRKGREADELQGTRIPAEKGSPFAIEVLVKRKAKKPSVLGGFAYVELAKDDVYQVKLINDAEFETAVDLRVDGLSMFRFSEAKGLRYMIVPPKSSVVIAGWHASFQKAVEFKITEYPQSAAASVGQPVEETGVITATFHASWEDTPPPGEPGKPRGNSPLATGFGKPIDDGTKPVKRNIGVARASVAVRYDRPRS